MPTVPVRQSDFSGGEIDPLQQSRTGSPYRQRGLATCRNMIPTPDGPMYNRPGLQWIGNTKTVAGSTAQYSHQRLIPFIFSDQQSFVVELGDLYARFWTGGTPVGGVVTPTEIVTPWAAADLDKLKFSQVGDVIVVTHASYQPRTLSRVTNTNWVVALISFANVTPWVGGTLPSFDSVKWDTSPGAYSNAVNYGVGSRVTFTDGYTYIAIGNNGPGTAVKAPNTNPDFWQYDSWSSTTSYNEGDYVYKSGILYLSLQTRNINQAPAYPGTQWWGVAIDSAHLARDWTWGFTFLWKDSGGVDRETLISAVKPTSPTGKWPRATDRPALISAINSPLGAVAFYYQITGVRWYAGRAGLFGWLGDSASDGSTGTGGWKDDGREPNYSIQPPMGTNPFAIADGAGSAGTSKWPAVVTHHDQRRIYMRSDAFPGALWGSAVGQFDVFDRPIPVQESNSYKWQLANDELAEIRSAVSLERLMLFTGAGVWSADGGAPEEPVSSVAVNVKRRTRDGATWLQPLPIGTRILFQTARGNLVRDIAFDFRTQSWPTRNLSVYGRHLLEGRNISSWCYQQHPHSIVWVVCDDGSLFSLTYRYPDSADPTETPVMAWARHDTGQFDWEAQSAAGQAGDFILGVCCVPSTLLANEIGPDAGFGFAAIPDSVYMLVSRAGVVSIERLAYRESIYAADDLPNVLGTTAASRATSVAQSWVTRESVFVDSAEVIATLNMGTAFDPTATVRVSGASYAAGADVSIESAGGLKFTAAQVGGDLVIDVTSLTATETRIRVTGFVDQYHLTGQLQSALPVAFQNVVTTDWGFAYAQIPVLRMGGRQVMVLADGIVQGPFLVPAGGGNIGPLEPPSLYAVIGLPYYSDAELLDIGGEGLRGKVKTIDKITWEVMGSRSLLTGPDFNHLVPAKLQTVADAYGGSVPGLYTGQVPVLVGSAFDTRGRACIRQADPLPLTVLAAIRLVTTGGEP